MAEHGTIEYATADGNDYAAHERTYAGFLTLLKWASSVVVIVLVLMAYFLV